MPDMDHARNTVAVNPITRNLMRKARKEQTYDDLISD